jgi:cyclohexadienyl dehydratase
VGSTSVEPGLGSVHSFQVFGLYHLFPFPAGAGRVGSVFAIAFSLLFLGLGCRVPHIGSAEPTGSRAPDILRVATSGDYVPFSRWPEDGEPIGFSVSVAQAYARDRGVTLEWVRFRWPELAADLKAGSFDLALSGITVRPDRSMLGRFSLPLTRSGAIVLVRADSGLDSALDLDRASIAIAVNAGGHLEGVARRLFPAARIDAIPDNAQVLHRLEQGAVDAIVSDTLEAPHWQQRADSRLRAIGPLTRDLKAAFFPPENEHEAGRFDRWLLRAETSGKLDELRRAHGLARGQTALAQAALLSRLDERLSLMRAVAEAKRILAAPIEDSMREALVLDAAVLAVQDSAQVAGIEEPDPRPVRRFFRAQIEAAKWIQAEHLQNAPATLAAAKALERTAAKAELDEVIRPALIYLGDRIAMLLIACMSESPKSVDYEDLAIALERHDLPESRLRALHAALLEIVMDERRSEPLRPPPPEQTSRVPIG